MYSPRIDQELVIKLYKLKHSSIPKRPMTKLVREAIIEYLDRRNNGRREFIEANNKMDTDTITMAIK